MNHKEKIRKISIGNDLKDGIFYMVGAKCGKGFIKHIIYDNELFFDVYVIEGDIIRLWKSCNKLVVGVVEFDTLD